jgi:hypothetical protein
MRYRLRTLLIVLAFVGAVVLAAWAGYRQGRQDEILRRSLEECMPVLTTAS